MEGNDLSTLSVLYAYVEFVDVPDGKKRPALVASADKGSIAIYRITSSYKNKDPKYQKNMFEVKDLKSAGLKKKSWIDVNNYQRIAKTDAITIYGALSDSEAERFIEFWQERYSEESDVPEAIPYSKRRDISQDETRINPDPRLENAHPDYRIDEGLGPTSPSIERS